MRLKRRLKLSDDTKELGPGIYGRPTPAPKLHQQAAEELQRPAFGGGSFDNHDAILQVQLTPPRFERESPRVDEGSRGFVACSATSYQGTGRSGAHHLHALVERRNH